jgi:hypothetical protein
LKEKRLRKGSRRTGPSDGNFEGEELQKSSENDKMEKGVSFYSLSEGTRTINVDLEVLKICKKCLGNVHIKCAKKGARRCSWHMEVLENLNQ